MGIRVIHVITHDSLGWARIGSPSAGRTSRLAARNSQPIGVSAGRRRRDRRGLGLRVAGTGQPVRVVSVAASGSYVSRCEWRYQSGRARRLCGCRAGGKPRCHPDGNGFRSTRSPCRRQNCSQATASAPRSSRRRASICFAGNHTNTGTAYWDAFQGSASKPRLRATGRAGSATAASTIGVDRLRRVRSGKCAVSRVGLPAEAVAATALHCLARSRIAATYS